MKYILLISTLFLSVHSFGQKLFKEVFNKKYCFENSSHSLTVLFKVKKDTVLLFYYDIIEGGKYLNGFDEEDDYAGEFSLASFKNNQVKVVIKNYRDESFKYILSLQLNPKRNWIYWNINQKEPVGYLVKHATLKICK
ncbi:MAG: hypothetical protein ACM3H8_10460 [Sphingobacteriales bacterium]